MCYLHKYIFMYISFNIISNHLTRAKLKHHFCHSAESLQLNQASFLCVTLILYGFGIARIAFSIVSMVNSLSDGGEIV